jgi:hypothetical protein
MNRRSEIIQTRIESLRQQIIQHKVYNEISSIEDLKAFMHFHVYAVWDFMSLLKALQNNLTCTSIPWFPLGTADTRYLINEIVVGEESDIDQNGVRKSHFELYLNAMQQCGANTSGILNFLSELKGSGDFQSAYAAAQTPKHAATFVDFTFEIIHSNKAHLQAAIFTFGREDLIPGMFLSLVNEMNERFPEQISTFKYYLDRHIEVDGDHHSHLALQMTANLCGEDDALWQEAEAATIRSLEKRLALWDGAFEQIVRQKQLETERI